MNRPVFSLIRGNLLKILAPVKPSGMFVLKMLPEPGEAGLKPRRPSSPLSPQFTCGVQLRRRETC